VATLDVTLARIRSRRAEIDPLKVAQLLLIALPWVLGWVARKVAIVLWIVGSFLWVALADGWTAGARPEDEPG
jgi:hypothetical protein